MADREKYNGEIMTELIDQRIEDDETSLSLTMDEEIRSFLRRAIEEDKGPGDITTISTISPNTTGDARVVVKETGILCGSQIFEEVLHMVNDRIEVKCWAREGQTLSHGRTVFTLKGPMVGILTGERLALNLLGLMSGVATTTSEHVKAVRHTKARITDTRKTTPLLRRFEKYAVRVGGGINHRMGLYDMIVIKDNHVDSCGGIQKAVNAARKRWGRTFTIEVETRNLDEVREAVLAGVDRIMLDNMDIDTMMEAVRLI
ncbi:carboxylating nicotinate-nucleotide diphosphorylase, partial [bacterium]|nr:carboxylating nicotinate-nucleotide diphosphorylase [bacterium]